MKKGQITTPGKISVRWMVGAHSVWLASIFLLGTWWGWLLIKQAQQIRILELKLGVSPTEIEEHWQRTRRMLFGEGSFFFGLVILSGMVIFWFYLRDLRRQKSLQAFFASVTHELRTPLTSIRLQAEALADRTSASHLVRRLLEDVTRLEGQVERTLELARVEGGGPVYTESLQLDVWLARALVSWREAYADRADFKINVDSTRVLADPTALQIIFRNLIENSIRHSGRDRVSIEFRCAGQLRANRCVLEVADNGNGPGDRAEKLGQLFEKGSTSQGAGVGLYLVQALMEKMEGQVRFVAARPYGFQADLEFEQGTHDG